MDEKSRRFLDAAVSRGLMRAEDAEECARIWSTVREVGVEQDIQEIVVKKSFLTTDQVRRLSRELSGMRVGKYEIVEKIGEGGAGIVYKANQEPLDRTVAIKVLSSRRAGSRQYLERFRREARIAVTLNHQNIVRGLDFGHADGYHYFVMEYVEGDSLYEILHREGVLDERRALNITLQTVRALEHAFEFDLVHRDIKPENIMVTPEGVAKLCDLGLAKPSLVESGRSQREAATIGTPTYMSPEQIRGKDDTDFRSDIYSLGVTLYHMLAGTPPFTGESADVVVRKHLREDPLDPREHNLKVSSGAVAVVLKMLAKKPEERYPSLKTLGEDISALLAGRPPRHTIQLGAPRATGKVRIDVEEGSSRRMRITKKKKLSPMLIGVIALALLGIGAAVVLLKPFGKDEVTPDSTPEVANRPGPAPGTTPEEQAEEAFRIASTFEEQHPDASHEALVDQYDLVFKRFPRTQYGLRAKERLRELKEARAARLRREEKARADRYAGLVADAGELVDGGRYGAAAEFLEDVPEELKGTEYEDRLRIERLRILAAADKLANEVLSEADSLMKMGRFEPAIAELETLAAVGIDEIAARVSKKAEEIRATEAQEAQAREEGREVFRSVVGAAYRRAALGRYHEAENELVRSADRPSLAYFREQLDDAWRDLREASRCADALVAGANALAGTVEKFALRAGPRSEVAGKLLGGSDEGVRFARGTGEELVRYDDLATAVLARLVFEVLDIEKGEDHRAAALYFIVQGRMDAAAAEIEAAKVLGVDTAPLEVRRDLIMTYLTDRAAVEMKKAEVLSAQERYDEAAEVLAGAAATAPWFAAVQRDLGIALFRADRAEEGATALRTALELGDDDPASHYWLGEALLASHSAEPALKAYLRYLEVAGAGGEYLKPARKRVKEIREVVLKDRVRQLTDEARAAYRRKDWEVAIDKYSRLLDLAPKEEEALYWIGQAHIEKGDIYQGYLFLTDFTSRVSSGRRATDAKRTVRSLLNLYRDTLECAELIQRGQAAYDSGNYRSALGFLDQAVAAGPLSSEACYYRGRTYRRIGEDTRNPEDFTAALEALDRAIRLNPANMLAREERALTLFYLERYDEALEEARKAMKGDPTRWGSFNVAGLCMLEQEDYDQAEKYLTEGLEAAPGEPTLYINRALSFEGRKRYQDAQRDLETAVKKNANASQRTEIDKIFKRIAEATGGD